MIVLNIKSRALIIFLTGLLVLCGAMLWEYIFDKQDKEQWIKHIEYGLHKEERLADEQLALFKDSVDLHISDSHRDLAFVGFKGSRIVFWTNSEVGVEGLYQILSSGNRLVKLGNSFYESRRVKYRDTEYYALLRIKDSYPYTNKYVRNTFGKFLRIGDEHADHTTVSEVPVENGHAIRDKEGRVLFYIAHDRDDQDQPVSYGLLGCFILFFLSLFYAYNIWMKQAATWGRQLRYTAVFTGALLLLRYIMVAYRIPDFLYRLPIFEADIFRNTFIHSIGDLLVLAICIFQILYIFCYRIKTDFSKKRLRRYRYIFIAGFVLLVFLYADFFRFMIDSVIEDAGIHLNIARVINVELSSIIAFVAIILVGSGLLVMMDCMAGILKKFFSLSEVVKVVSLSMTVLLLAACFVHFYISFWEIVFIWGLFLLSAVNKYVFKREDVQRSVLMLVIFLFSVYMVVVAHKEEYYEEHEKRIGYAKELIEERDNNFEKKLEEIEHVIDTSGKLAGLISRYDERAVQLYLTKDLLDLTGYNYYTSITLCRPGDSLLIRPEKELWKCNDYFSMLIRHSKFRIPKTHFYSVADFDGLVSYLGRFVFDNITLYLRFDSTKDDEGVGYPQILSRKSEEKENKMYRYSYAKYKNGVLITSSGEFNYYKYVSQFGKPNNRYSIVVKDKYSHMLVPVDDCCTLVMSLRESTFPLYYINVLYAFLAYVILSSYALLFRDYRNQDSGKGTLRARIKNSILLLIFVLFVILTSMSIYLNTKSFESRHNAKARQIIRYINKELERLDCVDLNECPDIIKTLSGMSEVLATDMNIYSTKGQLVATSRPEIFQNGFSGLLVNPRALEQIVGKGGMSYVEQEKIGELKYMSAYMPLILENGKSYVLNVPYFIQNDELNLEIIIMIVIAVNIAIAVMVLAFLLSGIVAEQVTRPLQMVNDKLKQMRFGGKNEKIAYRQQDEVGVLVQEYNNMVEKLEESADRLAKSEREGAWREMARQIAHEIKNPLTPMKLNIQFMQRSLLVEDPDNFKKRFKDISAMLIEQIDNMASIASAFSDFAKMSEANNELLNIGELVRSSVKLFESSINDVICDIETGIMIMADRKQMSRVLVNVLKNAEQSIPEERKGMIEICVKREGEKVVVSVKDNGRGIPEEIRGKIFEPNFTTRSSGMGLGLSISYRIVKGMGGTMYFESEVNHGTTFFIVLDCAN